MLLPIWAFGDVDMKKINHLFIYDIKLINSYFFHKIYFNGIREAL